MVLYYFPQQQRPVAPCSAEQSAVFNRELSDARKLIGSDTEEKLVKLISGLTHWEFDVNFAAQETGQALLHDAAMVSKIQLQYLTLVKLVMWGKGS